MTSGSLSAAPGIISSFNEMELHLCISRSTPTTVLPVVIGANHEGFGYRQAEERECEDNWQSV